MSTFYSVSKRNYSFRPYNRKKGRRALKRKKLHTLLKTPRKQRKRRARRFYVPKSTFSHNDYYNPDNFCVFNSNGPSYTVNDILSASVRNKNSIQDRKQKVAQFEAWATTQADLGKPLPSWRQLRISPHLVPRFCDNIITYLQYVFTHTHNLGDTLDKYLDAIIYLASLNGIYLTKSQFKWWPRFKRCCNAICCDVFVI